MPSPSSSAGVVKVVATSSVRHRVRGNPSLPAPPLRRPPPGELVPAAAAYACRPPVHRRCILRHPRCRLDLDVVVVAVNPISPSSGLAVVTISTRLDDAGTCLAVSCAAAGGLASTADVCGLPLPGFLAAPPGTPRWAPAGLRRVAPGAPTPPPPGGRIPPSPSTSSLHRLPPPPAIRLAAPAPSVGPMPLAPLIISQIKRRGQKIDPHAINLHHSILGASAAPSNPLLDLTERGREGSKGGGSARSPGDGGRRGRARGMSSVVRRSG